MKNPSDKTYEEALADLAKAIEDRDETARLIPFLKPHEQQEANRLLRILDERIERGEAALAAEYDADQKLNAARDHQRVMSIELIRRLEMMYEHILPLNNKEGMEKWRLCYDESFNFLRLDAEERGLDNSDSPEKKFP